MGAARSVENMAINSVDSRTAAEDAEINYLYSVLERAKDRAEENRKSRQNAQNAADLSHFKRIISSFAAQPCCCSITGPYGATSTYETDGCAILRGHEKICDLFEFAADRPLTTIWRSERDICVQGDEKDILVNARDLLSRARSVIVLLQNVNVATECGWLVAEFDAKLLVTSIQVCRQYGGRYGYGPN